MTLHGWIILDKPLGLSSAQAVAAVKRILRPIVPKKHKIGHGGTLDPLATGVLPIALGEATKLAGYLLDATKGYDFTLRFGASTTTDDAEGAVLETSAVRPTADQINAVLPQFLGEIDQRPPAYSALKVEGERAYALARAGETVVLPSRRITIFSLTLLACNQDEAHFSAVCSKGTYVRSLARDLAMALQTVGHVSALRRTKAGPFTREEAISLDKLAQFVHELHPEQAILPMTEGLDDILALPVDPHQAARLRQGQQIVGLSLKPGTYMAMQGSVPVAIVEAQAGHVRVLRGLNVE